MSTVNLDNKGRRRTVTIAFRMSPEESEQLNTAVKLYGFRTKQDYIIQALLTHSVVAIGNPLMFLQFRRQLEKILEELKSLRLANMNIEILETVETMLKILDGFENNRK